MYDRENNKHLVPLKARQGDCVVGRSKMQHSEKKYVALELNEANVQAIFDRCLKREDTKEAVRTALFTTLLGYTDEEEIVIAFDKEALRKNEKNIRYLYGQLKSTHTSENGAKWQSVDDFRTTYMDTVWAQRKSAVLELLYLGSNSALGFVGPFSKKQNDTTAVSKTITPTLSPKDPAFPAWWEAHRAEWETQ